MRTDGEAILLLVCLLLALSPLKCGTCSVAHGQYLTARDRDSLVLAQCIIAEAGPRARRDAAAILHVLERRSTLPAWRDKGIAAVAKGYCTAFESANNTPRAVYIRALTREQVPLHIITLTDNWLAGLRGFDPCGGKSWHWSDGSFATPLPRVDCGQTDNVFYGAPKR